MKSIRTWVWSLLLVVSSSAITHSAAFADNMGQNNGDGSGSQTSPPSATCTSWLGEGMFFQTGYQMSLPYAQLEFSAHESTWASLQVTALDSSGNVSWSDFQPVDFSGEPFQPGENWWEYDAFAAGTDISGGVDMELVFYDINGNPLEDGAEGVSYAPDSNGNC